ncbi:MAG: hypothetical protein J6B39_01620, partial [Lachnospiraceae bacterium]|nr:hypothetical protein [Lachnospiraceae bacterium]
NKNVTTGKWVNAYSQEYEENVGYGFDEVCDWSAGITTKAESVHSSISGTLVGVDTDNIDEDTLNAISRAASGYKADPEVNFYVDLPAGTYKVTVYAGGLSNNNTYNLNRIFINGEEVVRDFATDPWNADIKSSNSTLLTLEDLQWTKRITLTDDTKVEIKSYNPAVEAGGGRAYLNAVVIEEAVPGIEVNETNFPDAIFREYVSNNFDTDLDGVLSEKEIENADRIMLDETGVADLTGIEYFTYLKNLHCFGCIILTKLDISKNVALESLNCQNTSISELDVSNNTELLYLECGDNNIGTLDVSNNTKLIKLSCSNTGITKLDISKNTALEVLYCDKNGLTKLDVSKNVALKELLCNGNQLTSLDVSTNTALETFSAANNKYDIGTVGCVYDLSQIASLDLTKVSKWTNATYADGKLSGFRATGKMTVYYTYDCGNDKKEQFGLTLNYTGEHNYVNGVCADCGALEGLLTITEDDSYVYVEGDMNIDTSDPLTMSTFKFYDASGNEVATLELRLGLSYTDTRKSGWLTVDGTTTIMKYAELHYEERKGNKIVISKEVWDSYFGDDVVKCKLVGSKQIEELDIEFDAVWDETSKPGVIMWNKVDSENLEYYMVRLYCNGTIYRTITVSNSSKYDFSQYINESGTYTVEVIAVFNKDLGVKTVMSDAFVYTRPEEELSASAKVWWAAKEGSTTPTIINWEPVPGAAGYSLKFYIEGKSGSYMATVYNTDELLSSFDLSNKYSSLISKAEAGAVLKCEIKALSGDITVVANADDDAVAVSGEYVLAETVEEEIKATVEQTTTDTIIEDIDNVGVDSMADAMQNNEEVLNKVEEVEKDFAKDNNVEVLPPTVEHPEVEAEDVKVVGAALNAASGSSIRLGFEKLDKKEEKHLNEKVYETVIQVDISLKDNEQDVKGKLKAPITITMKPPKGINKHKLVVLHYLDNGDIERIYPKLNDDGTITFSVTSFSAFVFANLVTYDEGVSDTTLPDVAVTPDEPDTPVVPDEPEKPNTPVVPDDEEDDYNYEYDPKDAIENRFAGKAGWQKVSGTWYYFNANGELKTGWVEDTDGKWYYMDEETGKMQTGWLKSKKSGLWYYMDTENGDMKYGGWLCDPESGRWYYLDANGAMCTSWILVDNKWYLLDTNGAMCTGWNLVNGEWYLLGSDGAMLTGWQTVGDKEYYLDELGKCLMNTTTPDGSKVDETGAKIE